MSRAFGIEVFDPQSEKGKLKNPLRIADPYATPVVKNNNDTNATASRNSRPEIKTSTQVVPLKVTKTDMIVTTPEKPAVLVPAHTVSKGDTLYGIARAYGLSVEDLKKMNNLSADTLSIGQKLMVK